MLIPQELQLSRKDAGIINKRIQFVFSQYKEKYDSILDKVT